MEKMRALSGTVITFAAMFWSLSTVAAPRLTQQQCNSYPFQRVAGKVTHAQLMGELGELEDRGYRPGSDDGIYPADLNAAQRQLDDDYRADCTSREPRS
jgi:hypothetical protein